jgi:hypothetical protein
MELLISGLLQSPAFLYRSELGEDDGAGGYVLTSYEIASELSCLLWAAPPDDELWNAAASGSLKDPAAIATQAKRLLASPRASLDRFTAQWLTVAPSVTVVPGAGLSAVPPSSECSHRRRACGPCGAAARGGGGHPTPPGLRGPRDHRHRPTGPPTVKAQLSFIPKDATLYPDMSAEIRAAMAEEVARLVASAAQGGREPE